MLFVIRVILRVRKYALVNASATWKPRDVFSVKLWGENLSDRHYFASQVPSAFGDMSIPAAPRTYGITFTTHFK